MSANNIKKVTLRFNISPEIHSQLQLRAVAGSKSLSEIVEQALNFGLSNLDKNKTSDNHTLRLLTFLKDDKVFQISPNDYKNLYYRGMALSSVGRYEEAISSFDAALKVKPDYKKAWYKRGFAFYEIDFYEEAINSYDRALEIESEDYAVWYNRGNALFDLGYYEKAMNSYDRALEIKPKDPHALQKRSIAEQQLVQNENVHIVQNEDVHKVTSINKQKITLYIPPELHRKLKIKAAIDVESMSSLVEKAIAFYMQYPEKVEEIEASVHGKPHQVHFCPDEGESQSEIVSDEVELRTKPEARDGVSTSIDTVDECAILDFT